MTTYKISTRHADEHWRTRLGKTLLTEDDIPRKKLSAAQKTFWLNAANAMLVANQSEEDAIAFANEALDSVTWEDVDEHVSPGPPHGL
jgi:hypothetical protein